MKAYVYVLVADNGLLKIGRTTNLWNRVRDLSRHYTFDVDLSFAIECLSIQDSVNLEHLFHITFHSNRVLLDTPGGTEFFGDCIYTDLKTVARLLAKNQNVQIVKLGFLEDIPEFKKLGCDDDYISEAEIFQAIKNRRLTVGMSQQQLAEASGLSKRTIERIESKTGSVYFFNIATLLKVLDIKLSISRCPETDRKRSSSKASIEI